MNLMDVAEATLLTPYDLDTNKLDRVFDALVGPSTDLADLYFQSKRSEGWNLEDGIIKSGSYSISQGVGVRAVSGEKSGFAYSDDIGLDALLASAKSASAISKAGQNGRVNAWKRQSAFDARYTAHSPLDSLTEVEKIELLRLADTTARAASPYVEQVMANIVATHEVVLVADHNGHLSADVRPLVRMGVTVIIEKDGKRESAGSGGGGRFGLDYFTQADRVKGYVDEAVRQALMKLEAVDAPMGEQTVVLGNGWPGVLLHEAVGHGLEGDFNRKGTSAFSGRIGEQVASKGVTVVDNGTMQDRRGSLTVDDEGVQTQCTTLIEDGILKGYMQDKMNAGLMGVASTGNGRRESYDSLPMPRMTNTYMLAGERDPQEIIESVENGLYAVNFGGGQVDITSGKFVFAASEAYLIENGKVTRPVKGATLIGNGPEIMNRISMIGNDLELDPGVGVCGKSGQSVPVGVGQPTLKIDGMTVGGTAG
ncbi:metalloprotease TldD [Leucothrix arctica]|uniref:Metalloprotease TldD n=1 Tax=Leucothrix arctica TaxID=1481894 RepID=A0A317C9U5_9GAMM|nr:metalloprotease TldD [Leucothrix arctica]